MPKNEKGDPLGFINMHLLQNIKKLEGGTLLRLKKFSKKGNLQNRTGLKSPPFGSFRHCATFFRKFFKVSKESPPSSLFKFCNRMYNNESQRVPPFHFSALCDIFEVFFQKFFKNFFKFCSQSGNSDFPVISRESHIL